MKRKGILALCAGAALIAAIILALTLPRGAHMDKTDKTPENAPSEAGVGQGSEGGRTPLTPPSEAPSDPVTGGSDEGTVPPAPDTPAPTDVPPPTAPPSDDPPPPSDPPETPPPVTDPPETTPPPPEPPATEPPATEPPATEPPETAPADTGPAAEEPPDAGEGGVARPSVNGALAVRGTGLVDGEGNPVRLRGVSTHGLAWYPQYVNEALFREMSQSWGINVVRLALYTAEYGGWCSGGDRAALRKLVLDGVDYAERADMYVIVDWHILSDGDPNTHKSDAIAFFSDISAELKDKKHVLYEICNEPNGGVSWSSVAAYAREVIPAIRANDPDCVILVGTPNWSQRVDEAARAPLSEFENVMYTLHFYSGTHKEDLRRTMTGAIEAGLPVFVSEFGITDASGNGTVDEAEADRWVEAMDRYGVSYVQWNLSNKPETSSLISSDCAKVSGLGESDLTRSGKWLLRTLSGTATGGGSGREPRPEAPEPTEPKPPEGTAEPTVPDGPEIQPGLPGPGLEEAPVDAGNGLAYILELKNAWQSGEDTFRQYAVTVLNLGAEPAESWRVEIPLGGGFSVESSWNGVFTMDGGTLIISNAGYNGALAPGESAGDIGFIVSGKA